MAKAFYSLRFRVFALLALAFAVMWGLIGYHSLGERKNRLEDARRDVQAAAEFVAADQRNVVEYTQQFMALMMETREVREFIATTQCQLVLAHRLKQEPRLANIAIALPNGDVICNSNPTPNPISIADRFHFQKALKTPELVIGEAVISRSSGKWSLPFARAIVDEAGQVQGVFVLALDLSWLNTALARTKQPEKAGLGLIDAKGYVLVRHPDPDHWVGRNAAETPLFKTLIAHGGTGTADAEGLDRVKRIFGFAPFADTDAGRIVLWVGVPRESVTADIERDFIWTVAIALVLLGLTFAAVWAGSERLLLRPISALSDTASRIGAGDLSARTGLRYTQDELGELARAFDDMAHLLQTNSELVRVNRALRVLSAGNRTLIHATDENNLLQEMCRLLVEVGGYRMAWVGRAETDPEKTVRAVAYYGHDEGYLEAAEITWADTESGRGPTGTAIRTGTTQVNQDVRTNPQMTAWREAALVRGYEASIALPLKIGSGTFGALTLYATEPDAFAGDEVHLLYELAEDIAFGIETLRTRAERDGIINERQHQAEMLRQSLEDSIQAIADMVASRDPYTAGHQRRVRELAVAIARKMGLPEEQIHGIYLAAVVHDMGKIYVPAEILSKPRRLTDIEFMLAKQHVQIGYDVIKNVKFPWPIATIVLQHHERLDGSGYPQGLRDGDILLESRIIAVADVVEAMSSHRPYRPALGIDAALKEIKAGSGTLFDPAVVDTCVKLFEQGEFAFKS